MRSPPVREPKRASVLTALASVALIGPFAVVAIRYAVTSGPVYLSDDLALVDLHVRDALHWQQQLGPFDRFGWNHPGPALYYLLSIFARILGSGARAEFFGAIVLNLLAALATVWVVRRRAGPLPALWCSVCLGVLAAVLGSTSPGATTLSESPLGALVTPWNPDVVILPLVLFCVLAAAGASGSALSLLGATLAGSFVVQTNVSTLPIVAVFLVAAASWAGAVQILHRRRRRACGEERGAGLEDLQDAQPALPEALPGTGRWWSRPEVLLGTAGSLLLVLMWIPPLIQQFTNRPGNLTLIWRFFTSAHPTVSVSHSLWAVLAVDAELPFGVAQEMSSRRLGQPHPREVLVLVLVLLIGVVVIALGKRRKLPFCAALGAGSLLGFVVAIVSVTRIVGPVYGYLIVWEVAVPVAALIGLGPAVLGAPSPRRAFSDRSTVRGPSAPDITTVALVVLAVLVGSLLSVETSDIPPLQKASDPTVSAAWRLVSEHVRPGREHVFVGDAGTNIEGLFTFFGLVDQLQEHGYHPRVSPLWSTEVGPQYLSDNREPLQIVLYPPSAQARRMSGYIGQTRDADIRVAPGPPTP